jgi:hypothetical protein
MSYDMGPAALLPILRKVCCGFLSPLKIHRFGEPATFGSSGKHTNHYTTEAIELYVLSTYILDDVFIFINQKKSISKFVLWGIWEHFQLNTYDVTEMWVQNSNHIWAQGLFLHKK